MLVLTAQQPALPETSGWLVLGLMPTRVVWKCVTTECGGLCVMISGVVWMQMWPADNWASLEVVQLHTHVLSMARELDPSSWTMCSALALSPDFLTVLPIQLVFITVPTQRMLVQVVEFNCSARMETSDW